MIKCEKMLDLWIKGDNGEAKNHIENCIRCQRILKGIDELVEDFSKPLSEEERKELKKLTKNTRECIDFFNELEREEPIFSEVQDDEATQQHMGQEVFELIEEYLSRKDQGEYLPEQEEGQTVRQGILLQLFHAKNKIDEETISTRAAGISKNIPSKISISRHLFLEGKKISLEFDPDPLGDYLHIRLLGGTPQVRSLIKLKVYYTTGEEENFFGRQIAGFGTWAIRAEKAQNIYKLAIEYQGEEI